MQALLVIFIITASVIYLLRSLIKGLRGGGFCTACPVEKRCCAQGPAFKNLCEIKCGTEVFIKQLQGRKGDCHRLRELGLCEEERVRKVADNGSLICQLRETRVVISQRLAKNILVESL